MNTAASTNFGSRAAAASDSYAIPINTATAIVKQIESGKATAVVHIGSTAFMGVQIASTVGNGFGAPVSAGALIAGTVAGGPAASAGLTAGDVITAIKRSKHLVQLLLLDEELLAGGLPLLR